MSNGCVVWVNRQIHITFTPTRHCQHHSHAYSLPSSHSIITPTSQTRHTLASLITFSPHHRHTLLVTSSSTLFTSHHIHPSYTSLPSYLHLRHITHHRLSHTKPTPHLSQSQQANATPTTPHLTNWNKRESCVGKNNSRAAAIRASYCGPELLLGFFS